MKLGWYARLVIVLAIFWAGGKATHEHLQNQTIGVEAQASEYARCLEMETQGIEQAGRRAGESCAQYSERQFPWLFGWEAASNEFVKAALSSAVYAALATVFYWAFQWIWAGRPEGWRRQRRGLPTRGDQE